MRVRASGLYTYPDVVVVCGEPQFLDQRRDTLLNPLLIVEVLFPSTEAYDRGRKFEHYRSIPSLREYLLVASDRVHADLYTLRPDGDWSIHSADGPGETIELPNVGCALALSDLYEGVELKT
jgi:Uma2 family endonuclease